MKDNTDLLLWKNSPPVLLTWLATLDLLNLKTLLPFLWHNLVIFFLVLHTWTWSERLVWFFLALFTPNPFISRGVLYNSLPKNHLYRFLQYSIICSSSPGYYHKCLNDWCLKNPSISVFPLLSRQRFQLCRVDKDLFLDKDTTLACLAPFLAITPYTIYTPAFPNHFQIPEHTQNASQRFSHSSTQKPVNMLCYTAKENWV